MAGEIKEKISIRWFLLTSLAFTQAGAYTCNGTLFGEECRYLCRCDGNVSCDMTGQCPPGVKCLLTTETAFFGPLCQYEEVVNLRSDIVSHPVVNDHDDSTCLSAGTTRTSITLGWPTPYSWFRFVMNLQGQEDKFTVSLNKGEQCQNMRIFLVDPLTVDVFCDNNVLLDSLLVEGEAVSSLCSIYISGGRNVALFQPTKQSFTFRSMSSELAVDGNLHDRGFLKKHCSDTYFQSDPWWLVTFQYPQLVFWVVIYKTGGYPSSVITGNQSVLQDVQVNTTGLDGVEVHHPSNTSGIRPIYVVILDKPRLVKTLTVYLLGNPRVLILCEVNVYAETWCPRGTYGLWCQHKCTCHANNQSCHLVTGQCSSPCPIGKYGFRCLLDCNPACIEKICDERYGECLACSDGYRDTFCDKPCTDGTYGKKCNFSCSTGCANTCNHVNGTCTCKESFQGPRCDACTNGTYGQQCNFSCSTGCADTCDYVNGTCTCKKSFEGPRCDACTKGKYGQKCAFSCSTGCADTCDYVNGTCTCKESFKGPRCDGKTSKPEPESQPTTIPTPKQEEVKVEGFNRVVWSFVWIIFVVSFLLCCLLLFCCYKRRAKPPATEGQPKPSGVDTAGE